MNKSSLGQKRTPQDLDFSSRDSYSQLFTLIQQKVNQWHPFAKRPIDFLTVVTPGQLTSTLKRPNDVTHNGYPYRTVRPIGGVMGAGDKMVVVNDPQGPFVIGMLTGDPQTQTISFANGAHVASNSVTFPTTAHRGIVTLTTSGTAPIAGETLLTCTFSTAMPIVPVVLVQNQNGTAQFAVSNVSVTGFTITAGVAALAASTSYTIGFVCEV